MAHDSNMNCDDPLCQLEAIFKAGLARVDPFQMIMDHVQLTGTVLEIDLEDNHRQIDLSGFRQIFVIGAGKATAPMPGPLK